MFTISRSDAIQKTACVSIPSGIYASIAVIGIVIVFNNNC